MSYILDALKKSEKERRRGTAPDIMTVHEVTVEKTGDRPRWPYLLVIVLLLNAAIAALWIGTRQSKNGGTIPQTAVVKLSDTKTPVVKESSDVLPTFAEPTKPANPEIKEAKTGNRKSVGATLSGRSDSPRRLAPRDPHREARSQKGGKAESVARPKGNLLDESSMTVSRQAPENIHSLPEPQPVTNERPEPGRIYNLKELPQSIQQSLPDFSISVYLYSPDPASRMVRINSQTMREGQTLSDGLKLEEISSDAVIFSYKNYRFRVGPR